MVENDEYCRVFWQNVIEVIFFVALEAQLVEQPVNTYCVIQEFDSPQGQ